MITHAASSKTILYCFIEPPPRVVLCLELVMGVLWLASACLLALRAAQFACSPKPAA